MGKNIHSQKHLKTYRKDLRNNATPAERFLWRHLKNKQLAGRRFLRQHSILNYIVDFYCPSERLIIELDGNDHFTVEGLEKDANRDKALRELGHIILRFENKYVFNHTSSLLMTIEEHFNNGN